MPNLLTLIVNIATAAEITSASQVVEGKASYFQATVKSALYRPDSGIPQTGYCAMRWRYSALQKELGLQSRGAVKNWLRNKCQVKVMNKRTGKVYTVKPIDWGPARWTNKVIDLDFITYTGLDIKDKDQVRVTIEKRED